MSLTPTKGLLEVLNGDTAVAAAVPGQFWQGSADQDASPPFGVVKLLDGTGEVLCQGDGPTRLDAFYEVVTYAEANEVEAVRAGSDTVHAAVMGFVRGATFDGWQLLRTPRLRRVIERPVIQEGEVRWHARGAVYELNFSEE